MSTVSPDSVAQDQLRAFIERLERMHEERKAIADDIKEIYAEAKGNGFDVPTIKTVLKIRGQDHAERMEKNALLELYLSALGMAAAPSDEDDDYVPGRGVPVPRAPAPARTREIIEEFDPETGEITEPNATPAGAVVADASGATAGETAPIPHPVEGTTPTSTADGDRGGQVPPPSQPAPVVPATYPEPGVIVMERCPPEGIVAHPFAACWPVNSIDVTDGVREPIVKIGKLILDGRGRYFAARDAGIEYPVVQYDGTDPLLDCIRWNLASREPSEQQRQLIAAKLAKLEPSRADDIMRAFDRHLEAAE